MRNLAYFIFALFLIDNSSYAQRKTGAIALTVTEAENGIPIPFANVVVKKNTELITGTSTDFDGKAILNQIDSGVYTVQITSLGFAPISILNVEVAAYKVTNIPIARTKMESSAIQLEEYQVISYCKPLIARDAFTQSTNVFNSRVQSRTGNNRSMATSTVTSSEISRMAARNPLALAATAGGTYSKDDASINLNTRGGRSDANFYYIDGVKVRGSSAIPQAAIQSITVLTGGLPASFENYETNAFNAWVQPMHSQSQGVFSKRVKTEHTKVKVQERHVFDLLLEDYEYYAENEFKPSLSEELSTFSIDVDNGSYTNVRRIINSGYLPPLASVRIEEFINYFPYQRTSSDDDRPFIVDTELGECPWNSKHQLLKVTLQADEIELDKAPPSNLVFLLDVSGSMDEANKLGLIKRAFVLLAEQMRPEDKVSIVVYAGSSGVILDGVKGDQKDKVIRAIDHLQAGGSTAGGEGIIAAYRIAEKNFIKEGINRVILATDGDFNVGVSDDNELISLIEEKRSSGVFLTTIGCGGGNYKDSKLEKLADHGNGNYAYIDSYREARKIFLKELTGNLVVLAKDVKFQIEFNPEKVSSYRLLGYENRVLADQDFNDDTKDAGELGAGQMVTAFYELVPPGVYVDSLNIIDKRYKETVLSEAASSGELLNLKIRYKLPNSDTSILIEDPVIIALTDSAELSENFRFASAVVEFGLLIRDSKFKGESSIFSVINRANNAMSFDPDGHRREFKTLAEMCGEMYASIE